MDIHSSELYFSNNIRPNTITKIFLVLLRRNVKFSEMFIYMNMFIHMCMNIGDNMDLKRKPPMPFLPPKSIAPLKLLVLDLLKEKPMHGYEIIKELEKLLGKDVNPGVLYRLMKNLKNKKLVKIIKEEERGKKIYAITDLGIKYLSEREDALKQVKERVLSVKEFLRIGGKDLARIAILLFERIKDLSEDQKAAISSEISNFAQKIWDILEVGDDSNE